MEIRLDGEVAIVTGGDSGLGRAVGLELAHSGAAVIINFHSNRDKADEVVDTIERANGRCLAVQGDVSLEPDVERLFKTAVDELGGVDILIANAGIQKDAPIAEMSLEDWRAVLDLNLTGQFLCARAAIRRFRKQGKRGRSRALGKILCMSSVHERIPWAGHAGLAPIS